MQADWKNPSAFKAVPYAVIQMPDEWIVTIILTIILTPH